MQNETDLATLNRALAIKTIDIKDTDIDLIEQLKTKRFYSDTILFVSENLKFLVSGTAIIALLFILKKS